VLAVLFNVPRFFQYSVIYERENNDTVVPHKRLTAMGASAVYDIFYLNVFHTAVLFILPLIVLVIMNAIIIRELQVSKANMQSRSLHYIGYALVATAATRLRLDGRATPMRSPLRLSFDPRGVDPGASQENI